MDIRIPAHAAQVLAALEAAGHTAWVVGGCVRDTLLGIAPKDWDVCTDALPEETMAALAAWQVIPTGLAHGTVTAVVDALPVEITTFRTEGLYSDSRHPDAVHFVSDINEDLARRDFTINAMAYRPGAGLADPFGGQADLSAGVLRCVGDAQQRLREDALRILRGLRFAARFGFCIEAQTADAMHALRDSLHAVSAERIFAELTGLLEGVRAGDVLRAFPDVIFSVIPELAAAQGFDQHTPYHCWDVWTHTTYAVDAAPAESVLRLTMLLHDAGKPACFFTDEAGIGHFYGHPAVSRKLADNVLCRLRCDNARRETILALIEHHDLPLTTTDKGMRRLLARFGQTRLQQLLAVQRADNAALAEWVRAQRAAALDAAAAQIERLLGEMDCFSLRDLALGGNDILALGAHPGPTVGRILRALLEACMQGELPNERGALLDEARRLLAAEADL